MRTEVASTGGYEGCGGRSVWPWQPVHVIPGGLPPAAPHQPCRAQHGQPWCQASLRRLTVKLQQVSEAGAEHDGPPHCQDKAQVVTTNRRGESLSSPSALQSVQCRALHFLHQSDLLSPITRHLLLYKYKTLLSFVKTGARQVGRSAELKLIKDTCTASLPGCLSMWY